MELRCQNFHSGTKRGFTLIELLVVIAIIAILAVVVVLVLNPAELLKQSRDANRLSDMQTLTNAINLYVTDQSGSQSFSLGSSSVAYLSIPDPNATTSAGTDCSDLGTNFLAGGYFHCAASSTSRNINGTGWIPINFTKISSGAPIGALPVDPVNSTSSNLYYTYQTNGSTFRITMNPESQKYQAQLAANPLMFTAGSANPNAFGGVWIPVPGNGTFGTSNFWVMKYDAVCSNGAGSVVNTPTDPSYPGGYDNQTTACTGAGRQIASLPGGIPIVDIAETTAKQYCASIGAHLMTNDEYMTIDTNAAAQGSNWTSGTVGTGGMYLGNANNASEYPADPNDANGYSNGTGGTMANETVTNTGDERRTYTLSNGSVVWDMSGNVWEEVQRSDMNVGDNQTTESSPAYTGSSWTWGDFPSWTAWSTDPTTALTKSQVSPPNGTWTYAQGIGQLYGWGPGGTGGGTNAFIRGGGWNNGADDGPFTLYLDWGTGYTTHSVGFRCAR